ncbi:hypothetical protein QE197_09855 [Arsenophonus nasoniae]|nr:hypothetical protein [Arsenophonus nasoniae]QBY42762.1 hypothetical protein ArsFIN_13210 [Arsenophonus nasoniae]QBY43529.1 hypothetical protein ArsFIN_20970 [Arsenophonus nasoniae]QBY43752.1 hypothetical protein ArsFIN_23210 [Arsenophonus nasoniae]WGM06825.1 hypothetical protein QE258_05930 [Arsenophonus nasoniae]WGM07497.1 hypothetical protein QE258_09795 [Arsenophonus nasoniae]
MQDLTDEQIIEKLKNIAPDCPKWLLETERFNKNKKLTKTEQMEFAEYMVKTKRSIFASRYLLSCYERFGFSSNGNYLFTYHNVSIELDREVIENLLAHQIENPIMQEKPGEGFLPVWFFYNANDAKEQQQADEKWIQNFIDEVIIDGLKLFVTQPTSYTTH